MSNKEFLGLVLDNDIIQVAHLKIANKKLCLTKLNKITLSDNPENTESSENHDKPKKNVKDEEEFQNLDDIFGIDESIQKEEPEKSTEEVTSAKSESILDVEGEDEESDFQSNEMAVQSLLTSVDLKKVNIGINIPSGTTVFQIFKDQNYNETKKKDLQEVIQSKLEALYGPDKALNNYSEEIRSDGALVLASNENGSSFLDLVERSKTLYPGRIVIGEILPDEATLINLVRANYELEENEVTGIVLLGDKSSRLIFMKGPELWLVSPIINEGKNSSHVLGTIFSKILFQLDAGELPSLERIIVANNWLGEKAIEFFQKNFPDIKVEEFRFNPDKFEIDPKVRAANCYTTAIGMAWAASGIDATIFRNFSFLPDYIRDRQKLFKLEWHGVMLLLLIALTPLWFNHIYSANNNKIDKLQNEVNQTQIKIRNLHPVVVGTHYLSQKYKIDSERLKYVEELSKGTIKWSTTLHILNNGFRNIHGAWITSMKSIKGGLLLQGYSLYRNRIPEITDLFAKATLQSVSFTKVQNLNVYKYNIIIRKIVSDSSRFSPIQSKEHFTLNRQGENKLLGFVNIHQQQNIQ